MTRSTYGVAQVTLVVALAAAILAAASVGIAHACGLRVCPGPGPGVSAGSGALEASFYEDRSGGGYASNSVPEGPVLHRWFLRTPCQVDDAEVGACTPGATVCQQTEGRVVGLYYVDRYRLVQADGTPVDGQAPPAGQATGTIFGTAFRTGPLCVDVTELNPAPTPEEVFRYFQTLPLPQLTTVVQPPGGRVLVGLPTIFYTDAPTEQVFTVDIRGFAVVITAGAESFAWHTGDGGAVVTSEGPGAAYPDQTVTYDYTSGTYSTYVTVTWGGTFTVDGSAPVAVAGTTTTDGPAVQLTAVQAHAVLTDPYD